MNTFKIFIFFFIAIGICFSDTPLVNELHETLRQMRSEDNLSYAQYQYIINELEAEPNCKEIRLLFTLSQTISPEIQEILDFHCPQSKLEKSEKPKKKSKTTYINSSLSYAVYPRTHIVSPVIKSSQRFNNFSGNLDFHSNTGKIYDRSASYESSHWEMTIGNFKIPRNIPFVGGRAFWYGQNSLTDSLGLLFTQRNLPNGIIAGYPGNILKLNAYGSWNHNRTGEDSIFVHSYGMNSRISVSKIDISMHSNLTRYNLPEQVNENNFVHGLLIEDKFWKAANFGIGFSHSENLEQDMLLSNLYAEATLLVPGTRSYFKVFQAARNWTSPLMTFSARTIDTTENGLSFKGRSEGGFSFFHAFSLTGPDKPSKMSSNGGLSSRASLSSTERWKINDNQFRYRHINCFFDNKWKSYGHKLGYSLTSTESSNYFTLKNELETQTRNAGLFSAYYSHKMGGYHGTFSRALGLGYGRNWSGDYKFKIKGVIRDILHYERYTDILFLQVWRLSSALTLEWTLRLPFENFKLSEYMYYQGRFRMYL